MKYSGISFYFVLYLVAIVSVFFIAMERDHLLKERDEDIAHLVELHIKPLRLEPYDDTVRVSIAPSMTATEAPIEMRARVDGPLAKEQVRFSLLEAGRVDPQGGLTALASSGTITSNDGDAVLLAGPLEEGVYRFRVAASTNRITRDGNNLSVRIQDTTYVIPFSPALEHIDSDTVLLIASVEKSGVNPLQLTLAVQEKEERWVLGPPYAKKLFFGGIEDPSRLRFTAPPDTRIERATDGQYAILTWDRPVSGKRTLTVVADASRGLGGRDRASITFSVSVLPPSFIVPPADKGFWGVPYSFDARLEGLNPVDLSVRTLHDGLPLATRSAAEQDTVVPDRNWRKLKFEISYRGHVVKEHELALSSPPPPQIRWLQQNLDRSRNVFTVSLAASDAANGPVRMSLDAQPAGAARLDQIRGKTFTVSVNLAGNPEAVFLKITAVDRFGGQSTSTKQFNIPK
jgi:hypothetical protein